MVSTSGKHLSCSTEARHSVMTTSIGPRGIPKHPECIAHLQADPITDLFYLDVEITGSGVFNRRARATNAVWTRLAAAPQQIMKSVELGESGAIEVTAGKPGISAAPGTVRRSMRMLREHELKLRIQGAQGVEQNRTRPNGCNTHQCCSWLCSFYFLFFEHLIKQQGEPQRRSTT